MDCSDWQELISAHLDGETTEVEGKALLDHVDGCARCRRYQATASSLHGRLRISEVPAVPDQTAHILRSMSLPATSLRQDLLRALVAGLGVAKMAAALGVLVAAWGGTATAHPSTEVAAFDLAIGAALLLAAWRPGRAAGLVPVLAVLAVGTLLAGATDLAAGRVSWTGESLHLLDGVAAFLVWRLSTPHLGARQRRRPVIA